MIREIDLTNGIDTATVSSYAGTPTALGFLGDGGPAGEARVFRPQGFTRCPNGDIFFSDTGNSRVRRIETDASTDTTTITTVLGTGVAASFGEGAPANLFSVNTPLGLACDAIGNLFVTSTTAIRLLLANDVGVVDGEGPVQTVYSTTLGTQLTDVAVVDPQTLWITEASNGQLIELSRQPR